MVFGGTGCGWANQPAMPPCLPRPSDPTGTCLRRTARPVPQVDVHTGSFNAHAAIVVRNAMHAGCGDAMRFLAEQLLQL